MLIVKDVEEWEPLCAVGNVNWYSRCGKQYECPLNNWENRIAMYFSIPLLDTHLIEMKSLCQRDTCARMLMSALFSIPRTWHWSRCPSWQMNAWRKRSAHARVCPYWAEQKVRSDFFHKMLQGNWNELFGQPNNNQPWKRRASCHLWQHDGPWEC